MIWNEENTKRLQKLWKEGNTARQVAEALGQGCTRNAVIGKLFRIRRAEKKLKAGKGKKGGKGKKEVAAAASRRRKNPAAKTGKTAKAVKTAKKSARGPAKKPARKTTPKTAGETAAKGAEKSAKKPAGKRASGRSAGGKSVQKGASKKAGTPKNVSGKAAKKPAPARKAAKRKKGVVKKSPPQREEMPAERFIEKEQDIGSLFGGGCKWPIGHPGEEEFHFCGKPRYTGFPYCEEHAMEASQPADRRRSARG